MTIAIRDELTAITQATLPAQRELKIPHDKQKTHKLDIYIERNGSATGLVVVYAKLYKRTGWSQLDTIDLSKLTEPAVISTGGAITDIKVQPIGVVGTFEFAYVGW